MSDFIFVTEKAESSGKNLENNNKFGKGTTYTRGVKKWRENAWVHISHENRNKGIQWTTKIAIASYLDKFSTSIY